MQFVASVSMTSPGRDGWVAEPMTPEMDDPRMAKRQRRFEAVTRRRQAAE
jgi:hypothetical protein